ncbi:MAG: hybrid sensor histidine kinase/response regulator [Deltaproteobacteria bacterium]|nr:hybrid sensor histidine kinase/response regulator [Candidatus Anaeroferrophillus wilburensis]MBN2889262.1 hybrid sensor histidine kinase/response regulator [Deltaproteobacteria bacterium]
MVQMLKEQRTILFVDDESRVLKSIKRGLLDEPYRCLFALNGLEALEIMAAEPVQVLVTDMRMPEMNGLELLKIVRDRYPQMVRMVLSGYAQTSNVLAAVNEGYVFRYLTKPWRLDEDLKAAVTDAFSMYDLRLNQQGLAGELERENRQLQERIERDVHELGQAKKIVEHIYRQKTTVLKLAFEKTRMMVRGLYSDVTNLSMAECLDKDGRQLAEKARQDCKNFIVNIDRMLLLADLESNQQPVEQGTVVLADFFPRLCRMAEEKAGGRHCQVTCQLADDLPALFTVNQQLLGLLCWNLMENALIHAPEGEISCRCFTGDDGGVVITIADNGPGLPAAEKKRVLEPFVQASNTAHPGRLGLGLALVRAAVKGLSGSMMMETDLGQGVSVTVTISPRSL